MSRVKKVGNHNDTIKKVVLYLRLSEEDRNKLTKEQLSESIKNQELLLRDYAESNGWEVVGVYNDEDYSGADRDRPEFNKMIKECEFGNVDIVLVKTQARFARDNELISKYIHDKFLEWNVQFITVVDRIDNFKKETKKTSQILGLTDEWTLEDESLNIRDVFRTKRENGQFTGSFAPYGYLRDPDNKNHLIPDLEVAGIIERIFKEYINGSGLEKIANGLRKDKILSPYEYKLRNGCKLKIPLLKEYVDYKRIIKTGTYIIKPTFINDTRKILENLTSIELITNNINFSDKFSITYIKTNNKNLKVYYSTKSYEKLDIYFENNQIKFNNINFENTDNWTKLDLNDEIPKNVTCIGTFIDTLDRTHELFYEFEVTLKENRKHTPFFYKLFAKAKNEVKYLNYEINIRKKMSWTEQTIKKILKDEIYLGNLLQFKTTTVSYKNKTIIYNDKEDWIRYDRAHKPLISEKLWHQAQERLNTRKKCCKDGKAHILANKIYCKNCNRIFYKYGSKSKYGYSLLCCKDVKDKWANCDNKKSVREDELHQYILQQINNQLDLFCRKELLIESNNNMIENDLFKDKIKSLEKEKSNINKELEKKETYFDNLYNDRVNGILTDKEFLSLKNKHTNQYKKYEDRLKVIEQELRSIFIKKERLKNKETLFNNYTHLDSLDINIVNDFIDKIEIGYKNENTNKRDINIIWSF